LLSGDQPTVEGLSDRLADEVPLDRAKLNQVENRPQGASVLEPLRSLDVALGQVGKMQCEDAGNLAIASEPCRHRHVELR